jgi:hypothetical protein
MEPLLACWLDCAATALLSLTPDENRRVWFVIDEFAALPKLEVMPRLSAMGRKYGSCLVAGVQSPSQLVSKYGREDANTLTATLGTQLFLRLPGGEPAKWASGMLGKTERKHQRAADVYETEEAADKSTLTTVHEVNDLVLDGDIAALADLHGYLRLPLGGAPIATVEIPTTHLNRPSVAEEFAPARLEDTHLYTPIRGTPVLTPPAPTAEGAPAEFEPLGLGGRR